MEKTMDISAFDSASYDTGHNSADDIVDVGDSTASFASAAKKARSGSPSKVGDENVICRTPLIATYFQKYDSVLQSVTALNINSRTISLPRNFNLLCPALDAYIKDLATKNLLEVIICEDLVLTRFPYLALMDSFNKEAVDKQTEAVKKAFNDFHGLIANVMKPYARSVGCPENPGICFVRKCYVRAFFDSVHGTFNENVLAKTFRDSELSASLNILDSESKLGPILMDIAAKCCKATAEWIVTQDGSVKHEYNLVIGTYYKSGAALLESCFNIKEETRESRIFKERKKLNNKLKPKDSDLVRVKCVIKPIVDTDTALRPYEKEKLSAVNSAINNTAKTLESFVDQISVVNRLPVLRQLIARLHRDVAHIDDVLTARKGLIHTEVKKVRLDALNAKGASFEEIEADKSKRFTAQEWNYVIASTTGQEISAKFLSVFGYDPLELSDADIIVMHREYLVRTLTSLT